MHKFSKSHLDGPAIRRGLRDLNTRDNGTNAEMLAYLVEMDAQRLYASDGYPSAWAWCVTELHMSEGMASKRIFAARKAAQFPILFEALADGRLNLSALVQIGASLSADTVAELVTEATHKTREQIDELLARRFPRPDVPTLIAPLPSESARSDGRAFHFERSPGNVARASASMAESARVEGAAPVDAESSSAIPHSPGNVPAESKPRIAPLSPDRFAFQATISSPTRELLKEAQDLLGFAPGAGDMDEILRNSLLLYVAALKKQKFAETERPSRATRSSKNPHRVPARVQRAVAKRDGHRCTFVGTNGRRCEARKGLEFDHVVPVERGGASTVANVRLLCKTHNQFEAARVYGEQFMKAKRERARREAAERKAPASLTAADFDAVRAMIDRNGGGATAPAT